MDIRQLNYFVQIADSESYSLASQKLFISQPALSKAIKSIEDEMGFSFFYTHQRKQKLTDEGRAFYEKAVKFLESYDELINTTYLEAGVDKGHLNIGLSVLGGPALFAHIFPIFRSKYPQITVSVIEKETTILKEEILKKNVDLAFIDLYHLKEPDDTDNFDVFKLIRSDLVVATSINNPLANLKEVQYEALDGRNMIHFNGGRGFSGQVESDMKSMGMKPEVVLSSSQWNFIMDMVAADMGVALCPYYIFSKFCNSQIVCVPLNEEMGKRNIGIIAKKGEYRTRACATFLNYAANPSSYDGIKRNFSKKLI